MSSRALPEWYDDAKFGLMFSWGLFTVPSWAPLDPRLHQGTSGLLDSQPASPWTHFTPRATTPYADWYQNSMSLVGTPTWLYHAATYAGRSYESFSTEFESAAAAVDVDEWIDTCRLAGARYLIQITKFHDGYSLWPTQTPHPRRAGFATESFFLDRLARAARGAGIRFGAYYSGGIDWTFGGLPVPESTDPMAIIPQDADYARYADAQLLELIDRFHPDVLWNDIGYPADGDFDRILAHYRAEVPHGVINDRFSPTWPTDHAQGWGTDRFSTQYADFITPEYEKIAEPPPVKWELVRGLGWSFAYNRNETAAHTLTWQQAINQLADACALGGNLVLGVGPTLSGEVSAVQMATLRGMGRWLARNGEAIYGTRPADHPIDHVGSSAIRWTQRPGIRYGIVDGCRGEHLPLPRNTTITDSSKVSVLGFESTGLRAEADGQVVEIPAEARTGDPIVLVFEE